MFFPLFTRDSANISDVEFFSMLKDDGGPLSTIKNAAKGGNIDIAKDLFLNYTRNRPSDTNYQYGRSLSRKSTADDAINRIFEERDVTRQFKNLSNSDTIIVNGREIPNTNWHDNPYPEDEEWIYSWSHFGFLRAFAEVYNQYVYNNDKATAEYYAEAIVDLLTDFIRKEPVGTSYVWRTIDSAKRIDNLCALNEAIKNSNAYTADFCISFHKFMINHARFLFDFHKEEFNWAFIEALGLLDICAYFPEFDATTLWEAESWSTFENAALNTFYPDGGSREQAFTYHQVSMERLAEAIQLDQNSDVISGPPNMKELVENAFVFTAYVSMPDFGKVAFGDSGGGSVSGSINTGKQLYPDNPVFAYFNNNSLPSPNLSVAFPDSGLITSRSKWSDSDALYAFMDGSVSGEFYHYHEDFSNIALYGFGREFLIDPGISSYTWNTYSQYFKDSHAHNVVLVDGKGQGYVNPATTSFHAGYLGSISRVGHKAYSDLMEREVIFANFRNTVNDANLTGVSSNSDTGRYWIVSDFWHGAGTHSLDGLWHMPNTTLVPMNNASNEISEGSINPSFYCSRTNFTQGNIGIYAKGPWDQVDVIRGGDPDVYGQPYGWRGDTGNWVEPSDEYMATTIKTSGSMNGKGSWFTLFYPTDGNPNITVTPVSFHYDGQFYQPGNEIGNAVFVETQHGSQFHISLMNPTQLGKGISTTLPGIGQIYFEGRQISMYFNETNNITQILSDNCGNLAISGEAIIQVDNGDLVISENTTLDAITVGDDNINNLYLGASIIPETHYIRQDNAINIGKTVLEGGF